MPKAQSQRQLEFVEAAAMQWEDLPPLLRARVCAQLTRLLRQAAGASAPRREDGDDE